jgi:predicted amidohydrolase
MSPLILGREFYFPSEMEDLKITIIQTTLYWENAAANRQLFEKHFAAIQEPTDIIVLPEMFTTGFTMHASANAETMDGETIDWLREWSKKKNSVITGSIIVKEHEKYFNRLIWMKPDGNFLAYDKRHLFRLSGEEEVFSAANKKLFIEIKDWKILPLICYDLRFPVWSRRTAEENYDVLIYVANWPERRISAWKHLLPARAIENQSYVVGVNRVGKDGNGVEHRGESAVIDFRGEKINKPGANAETVETISLSYPALENFRSTHPFHLDADEFELK